MLWGASAYFVARLAMEYDETGSKEKVSVEIEKKTELDPPWIWISKQIGSKNCQLVLDNCNYFRQDKPAVVCNDAIVTVNWTAAQAEGNLLHAKKMRELGGGMVSAFDEVELLFYISDRTTGEVVPSSELIKTCFEPSDSANFKNGIVPGVASIATAVPIGDDSVIKALSIGADPPDRSIGTPLWLGLGNLASLSFSLQQEVFIDNSVKNTTLYAVTQMTKHPINLLEFHVNPATFSVSVMKHQPGQSLLDLLGSIFGWLGVLTGACILSLIDMAASTISRYRDAHSKWSSKQDPLVDEDIEKSMSPFFNPEKQLQAEQQLAALKEEVAALRAMVMFRTPQTFSM